MIKILWITTNNIIKTVSMTLWHYNVTHLTNGRSISGLLACGCGLHTMCLT